MPREAAELVFDEATKVYPGRESAAVDHLSLTVPAGEIWVLVALSGAGKTTGLKLVTRLIPDTTGDSRIDGTAILAQNVDEHRRSIGDVLLQVGLPPPPERDSQDGCLRHARRRRGDQGRRPDRDPPRGRPARPVRHAAADPRAPGGRVRRGVRRPRPRAQGARPAHAWRARALPGDRGRAAPLARGHEPPRRAGAARRRAPQRAARHRGRRRAARHRDARGPPRMTGWRLADGGPVIPNFGHGSECLRDNGWLCTSWVRQHWGDILEPG